MHTLVKNAENRMQKCIEGLKQNMSRIRTGRAHPSLLEHILVNYYGSDMPIQQVANISVSDPRTLTLTPWDKKMIPIIEKAILTSDLGLNPTTSGDLIRVPLPPLTEDRRKELIKVVRGEAEQTRVAIRNARRDANHACKESLKKTEITEDDERRLMDAIQKLTDHFIADVDKLLTAKENDLMVV